MNDRAWIIGYNDLCEAFPSNLSEDAVVARGRVYRKFLDHLTDDEWASVVHACVKGDRFFPAVARLIELADDQDDEPVSVEAVRAYERVVASGSYGSEGTTWIYREVLARCGAAAARAFMEAGGTSAFESSYHETDRREKFIRSYTSAVRNGAEPLKPRTTLAPAAPPARMIAEKSTIKPGSPEWEALKAKLSKLEKPPTPEPPKGPTRPPGADIVNLDDHEDRLAKLREQARQIRGEHGEAPKE